MSCRKWCLLGLVLALLATPPMFGGGSKKGTKYAILVAISKYGKTDQWRPLPYTIDEMKEFRDVLFDTGFAKENIEFLHDGQADEKLRPTAANLVKKIKLMLDEIGPDDTLLVALNGHGVQYKGDATGYFCPVNADLLDKKTLVAMDGKDGLYALLESCKAKRKLLIVNACRNDPTRDLSFAAEKVKLVDKDESDVPKGIAALFSCKPGQKSYYYPEERKIKRSMFYHHLIEAWRGKYADGEKVTLDHVFDAVTRKTAADARTTFSESQTPWPRRKYEGEWVLANSATTEIRGNPQVRAIIEKAIKAHGGIASLQKIKTVRRKENIQFFDKNGNETSCYSSEYFRQWPSYFKLVHFSPASGVLEARTTVTVVNGAQGWRSTNGGAVENLSEDGVKGLLAYWGELSFLLGISGDEPVDLLDEITVAGKPAIGVHFTRMSISEMPYRTYRYFDKATRLLVKYGGEKSYTLHGDYRTINGVVYAHKYTHYSKDEKAEFRKSHETRVAEVEFTDKLDPKIFARP